MAVTAAHTATTPIFMITETEVDEHHELPEGGE